MKRINGIGNYYGGLYITQEGNKYYWAIENWDGYEWSEIDAKLYAELIRYAEEEVLK